MFITQYYRVESKAGGVSCTNREFIKAAHTILNKKGKTRAMRDQRHAWLRSGLAHLASARTVALRFGYKAGVRYA